MHLSKLELFGFKSFANKTVVNFTKGVTAIVGPNGCGKTNIVDALRWCLGEQKSSTLRSDKMENVIFNGTRLKKPMGMAEVSLSMDNDKGVLPTEYSEITITRRIFRSGESEYLLNKNICRLKDITNLFLDTGIGTNAYSVIELKMIETILSSKAEERRKMFEEAAGVNKYKIRRRLSLRRLDEVKSDLRRVEDIISEVEKQVRSLERQAKKADKYNQIRSVLQALEIDVAEREFTLSNQKLNSLQENRNTFEANKNQIDSTIKEQENYLLEIRKKNAETNDQLRAKLTEVSQIIEEIHSLQKDISVSEERLNSLSDNINRFGIDIRDYEQKIKESDDYIFKTSHDLNSLTENYQQNISVINDNDFAIEEKLTAVEKKRSIIKTINEKLKDLYRELTTDESLLKSYSEKLESTNKNIETNNSLIQDITNKIAKTVGFLEELGSEKKDVESKLLQSETLYADQQKAKKQLENELSKLKKEELEKKTILNGVKDKIDFFETLVTNLEGVPEGSRVLLENREWTKNDKTLFADVGHTEEKFRNALEASLKHVLNNLLVENFEELGNAIEYLKKNDLGKASFYLLEHLDNKSRSIFEKMLTRLIRRKSNKITREKEFLSWAGTLVETEPKWKPYFEKLLSSTVVVNSLNEAFTLHNKYPDFDIATLNGDFVRSNGIVEAGSLPKMSESLFGRKKMLENYRGDCLELERELVTLDEQIVGIENELERIDLDYISEQGKIYLNDLNNIDKQISQFEFENEKSSEEIDKLRVIIQQNVNSSNEFDSEIGTLSGKIEHLNLDIKKLEEEHHVHEEGLTLAVRDLENSRSEQNEFNLEIERLKGKISTFENSIRQTDEIKYSLVNSIENRKSDIERIEIEINSLTLKNEKSKTKLLELEESRNAITLEKTDIETKLTEMRNESSKLEDELNELRNQRVHISDKIHEFDVQSNRLSLKVENLSEHIKEEYSIELEIKHFDDLDSFNYEEKSREVSSHKEKLKNLGPINLLAFSEYEEEKERYDFLKKQQIDLIESEKDIIKTIEDINKTAETLFIETFEEIRANFKNIFQTLFNPGDEADLILEENSDPLESKIEIIAKPKGKRPTSIELLSGGEKTLTAIALLFSIYLVKPSPFCILDEVDAPLDDANIDRFTKLVQEFSSTTQFVIVTHNKRTMEAAQNLYGVTIQDEGISKLVGVQFNEELQF